MILGIWIGWKSDFFLAEDFGKRSAKTQSISSTKSNAPFNPSHIAARSKMATTQPFHRPSYGSLEDHRPEGSAPFTMHSADGNTVTVITLSELTDLRAMQRTFELAYLRTSLGEFCFACLVLKLFSSKFQFIGLIYTVLCLGISVAAYWRYRVRHHEVRSYA